MYTGMVKPKGCSQVSFERLLVTLEQGRKQLSDYVDGLSGHRTTVAEKVKGGDTA